MPSHAGPNIVGESNIVFAYDTGDVANSYLGEPTTNHYGDIDSSIALRTVAAEYNTSNWTGNFAKPPLNIGRVYKHTSGALNSTWSGNSYGYTLKNYTYPSGATYTLSVWVYVSPDCNISQLNISIEGGGSWIDYNYQYDLNNKGTWQRIWLKINTGGGFSGNAIPIYPQRWGVTDGSFTGFYAWGGVMLEAKDHITQYTVSSRSATQGLLPLISNTSINLSKVSFNSNAQIVFDGTDDYINLGSNTNWAIGGNGTIEMLVKPSNSTGNDRLWCVNNNSTSLDAYLDGTTYNVYMHGGTVGSTTPLIQNARNHLVVTYSGGTIQIYINGIPGTMTGTTTGYNITNSGTMYIGCYTDLGYNLYGEVSVMKVYNTALTANLIKQNYQQYKTRFNLS